MSPPLIAAMVALLAALVTCAQGLRMLTATHRLRDGLGTDKDLHSALDPGRIQDELRRSIDRRALELVVLVERPAHVAPIALGMLFMTYLVVLGGAVAILEAVTVPVVIAAGALMAAAIALITSELVRAHLVRNKIRVRLGLPSRRFGEPPSNGEPPAR